MSDKNAKALRKAIRNTVQELFPQILSNELVAAVHKNLAETVNGKLKALSENVDKQLSAIDERSKNMQAYIVSRIGTPAATPEPTPETPPTDAP
jgi:hypothetical protein